MSVEMINDEAGRGATTDGQTFPKSPSGEPRLHMGGTSTPRFGEWMVWVGVALLVSLAQVMIGGYQFGAGNQTIQVPFLKWWMDPALYGRDVMVQETLKAYPSFFYQVLAWVCRAGGGDVVRAYAWLHVLTTFGMVAGVLGLGRAMFRNWWAGLATAGMMLCGHIKPLAGDELYSLAFTHTYAVFPLALLALGLMFRGRVVWAMAVAGLVFNLHALTGAYLACMLGAAMLGEIGRVKWWTLAAVGAFVAAALPTAIAMLGGPKAGFDATWLNLTYIRSEDHSFASSWWAAGVADVPRLGLVLGLGAVGMSYANRETVRRTLWMAGAVAVLFGVGYLCTEVWPQAAVIRAQLFRSSRYVLMLGLCHAGYGVVRGMEMAWRGAGLRWWQRGLEAAVATGAMVVVATPGLGAWLGWVVVAAVLVAVVNGRLAWWQAIGAGAAVGLAVVAGSRIGYGWAGVNTRMAAGAGPSVEGWALLLLIAAVLVAVAGQERWSKGAGVWIRGGLLAVLMAVWGVGASGWVGRVGKIGGDPWVETQVWAKRETPRDAVFLTPVQPGGFRVHSERAVVSEWRDGTQLYFAGTFARAWWERENALQPGMLTSPDGRRLLSRGRGLETMTEEELAATAEKYGAGYIVLPAGRKMFLREVHRNDGWVVYTPELTFKAMAIPAGVEVDPRRWQAQEDFVRDVALPNIEKYRKGDVRIEVVDGSGKVVEGAEWEIRQVRQAFGFGASLTGFFKMPEGISQDDFKPDNINDPRELARHLEVFNASVIPFSGKWCYLEPEEGKRTYEDLDQYVEWCNKNGVKAEFHFLSGYSPSWVRRYNQEKQWQFMLKHAREVVARYKDKIDYWQVDNEGHALGRVAELVREVKKLEPKGKLGISYCSRFHEGTGSEDSDRRSRLSGIEEVRKMKEAGVPVDYYATHGHRPFGVWADPREMYEMFDAVQKAGLKVHVTEFFEPTNVPVISAVIRKGTWTEALQGAYWQRFYLLCYSHPAGSCPTGS